MTRIREMMAVVVVAFLLAVAGPARAADVPVPADAVTDDVPVLVWIDLEAIDVDAILASVQSLAAALPENMADERDPMLADATEEMEGLRAILDTLREGGARGLLFVMSTDEVEGQEPMGLIYTAEGTTVESLQAAVNQVNEDDHAEVAAYADNWMRVVEEGSPEIRGGTEANATAFRTLLDEAGDAPIRVALRLTDDVKQQIMQQAADDPMMAGFAGMVETLDTGWVTVNFGEQPQIKNQLNFDSAEAAAEFNAAWAGLLMMAEGMVMGEMAQLPDAPEPDTVQGLFESLQMEQDGESLSLTLGDQFIGQAAEFVPALMGMFMFMMMGDAMQGMDMEGWEEMPEDEGQDEPMF